MSNKEKCAWLIDGNLCAIAVAIERLGRYKVHRFPNLVLVPTTTVCRPAQLGIKTEVAILLGDKMLNGEADVNVVADFMGNPEIIPILNKVLAENMSVGA